MNRQVLALSAFGLCLAVDGASGGAPFTGSDQHQALYCDLQDIRSDVTKERAQYKAQGVCAMREVTDSQAANQSRFPDGAGSREVYRFSWTATGYYSPGAKTTVEEISAPPPRIDEPTTPGRPYGRYQLEMICDQDPWLYDTAARCTQPRTNATGNLTAEIQQTLKFTGKPFTAYMKAPQRQALLAAQRQFDERQAMLNRIGNQQYSAAASTTRAGATTTSVAGALGSAGSRTTSVQGATAAPTAVTPPAGTTGTNTGTVSAALKLQAALEAQRAQQQGGAASAPAPTPVAVPSTNAPATQPAASTTGTAAASKAGAPTAAIAALQPSNTAALRITSPAANSEIRQGQLRVQVATSGAVARDVDVEFTNLSPTQDEKKASTPTRVQWTVAHDQLAQGAVVPSGSGPRSSGRWQMRVRPAGAASWSDPVAFDFVALSEPKGKAWGRQANELERQGLNPQPLPPKEADKASPLERQGLNPQPLPPKEAVRASTQVDQRALNPQPLPPKEAKKANPFERPVTTPQQMPPAATQLDRQGLNPQPLPPKEVTAPSSAFQR